MSLNATLNAALSGLTATSREADLIAQNIANSRTEGYTVRNIELAPLTVGGTGAGVRVAGVTLAEDPALIAQRRTADANLAASSTRAGALEDLADLFGDPGSANALAVRAAEFETALQAAASEPSSLPTLDVASRAASSLAEGIVSISTETQRMRVAADAEIAAQVAQVNANLQEIDALNRQIQMLTLGGSDASALIDARKALIDEVASIIPISEAKRDNGQVALFTANGATLLDGIPSELGFTATPVITQDMTLASGALSGLTLNGRAIDAGLADGSGLVDGGSLSAAFELRDTELPAAADKLDLLAEDLVLRFQAAGLDPTRGATDPGLFTDNGAFYDPANLAGLSGRLELNSAVDPFTGDPSLLRDGLYAAAPGEVGDSSILSALEAAAREARAPDAGLGISGAGSVSDFTAGLASVFASAQVQAEKEQSADAAFATGLRDAEAQISGVDTDEQLQRLLLVEQSYAANARVISVVDELFRRLVDI